MASRLNIYIPNIIDVINNGYENIKVYRSTSDATGFSEITTSGTRPVLNIDETRYRYEDSTGAADHWYKYSQVTSSGTESALSASLRGTISGSSYTGPTYPQEVTLTAAELDTIFRIRQIIGDYKEVNRDYISSATSFDNVSNDGYVIELDNAKGWPLAVIIDGYQNTSIDEPIVQGYQFLVFSLTQISTTSGTADIWYEHFRFSDKEIIETHSKSDPPAGLTLAQTTSEMFELQTAITLLEGELRNFMVTSSSRVSIYQEIEIDPSAGLRARSQDLEALRKKLKDLVDSSVKDLISNNPYMYGWRVD